MNDNKGKMKMKKTIETIHLIDNIYTGLEMAEEVEETKEDNRSKMRITKKTLNLLAKRGNVAKENHDYRLTVIADFLLENGFICGNFKEGFSVYNLPDKEVGYFSGRVNNKIAKKYFWGMKTRYPSLLSTTFTHGLNGLDIIDVNKLVSAIVAEE